MLSHPTNFQGAVIDALREAIERQIHNSRARVNGDGHFSIEVMSPAFAGRSMLERPRLMYGAIAHLMQYSSVKSVRPAHPPSKLVEGQALCHKVSTSFDGDTRTVCSPNLDGLTEQHCVRSAS